MHGHHQMVNTKNQIDYILCSQRWRSSIQTAETRLGADYSSDHQLLIANFRFKLKKVGKTTRPFRCDPNQIPCGYTVKVMDRCKGLDLVDRVPEGPWMEVRNIVHEAVTKAISKKNKGKKAKGLFEEASQIGEERRKAKGEGERERYNQLSSRIFF